MSIFKATYTVPATITEATLENDSYTETITVIETGETVETLPAYKQSFKIDFAEIAKIQAEREEMMIANAPNSAKMWGYTS